MRNTTTWTRNAREEQRLAAAPLCAASRPTASVSHRGPSTSRTRPAPRSVGRTWMLGGSEPFTSCSSTVCSESKARNAAMNSSADTPACLRMPAKVPVFSSRWFGTAQPDDPLRRTKWLPCCLTTTKPNRSSARTASLPESTGSSGIFSYTKSGQQWTPRRLSGILLSTVPSPLADRIRLLRQSGLAWLSRFQG